ncbi:MAG: DivIVA domain-containing protein [Clostridia bacterium]|nr:DivIVA domain-containing protein [Clostridia bacterium]
MLTPQDIEKKTFKRSFRGYSVKEVERFLREVGENYEKLYKENLVAGDRIEMLSDAVRQYKAMEDAMSALGRDYNPDGTAEHSEQEVSELAYRYEQMKRSVEVFRAKVVSLLHAQLEIIKDYSEILVDEKTLEEARTVYESVVPVAGKKTERVDTANQKTEEIPVVTNPETAE